MDKDIIKALNKVNKKVQLQDSKTIKTELKKSMFLKVINNTREKTVVVDTAPTTKGSQTIYRDAELRVFHDQRMAEIHAGGKFKEIVPLTHSRIIFED